MPELDTDVFPCATEGFGSAIAAELGGRVTPGELGRAGEELPPAAAELGETMPVGLTTTAGGGSAICICCAMGTENKLDPAEGDATDEPVADTEEEDAAAAFAESDTTTFEGRLVAF